MPEFDEAPLLRGKIAIVSQSSLRGARLFSELRGQAAIDIDALAECVSRASILAAQLCDGIDQIDITLVIASSDSAMAVDGLILSSRASLQDAAV
jgi:hypothetical protein